MVQDESCHPRQDRRPTEPFRARTEHELRTVPTARLHEVIRKEDRPERDEDGTDQEQEHFVPIHRERDGEQEREHANGDREQRRGRAGIDVQR